MLFDPFNARGAQVFDVEAERLLTRTFSVNTSTGEVVRFHEPLRVEGGEVASFTERYTTIHPIWAGQERPQLFHCYGRVR